MPMTAPFGPGEDAPADADGSSAPALAERFTVVVPDLPAMAQSRRVGRERWTIDPARCEANPIVRQPGVPVTRKCNPRSLARTD
jgi:hypothetical protein